MPVECMLSKICKATSVVTSAARNFCCSQTGCSIYIAVAAGTLCGRYFACSINPANNPTRRFPVSIPEDRMQPLQPALTL